MPKEYNDTIDYLVKRNLPKTKKIGKNKWPRPDITTTDGRIINEIAKKFNRTNRLGIEEFKYTKPTKPDDHNSYYTEPNLSGKEIPKMYLEKNTGSTGPDPRILVHELIHVNDHQNDNLNAKVWGHLGALGQSLHTKGKNTGKSLYPDFTTFNQGLKRIQDKIDPAQDFSKFYPLNEAYIGNDVYEGRKAYSFPNNAGNKYDEKLPYLPTGANTPNSLQLFNDINQVVNHGSFSKKSAKNPTVQNPGMFLGRGSEFPAFMSERLNQHWNTANGNKAQRLNTPEARFTRNVLNDMSVAYPKGAKNYPEMNNHIQDRAKSIENARTYSQPLTKGGRVLSALTEKISNKQAIIKQRFKIATSDPKEINRLLDISENGTNKQFNDYLLNLGIKNSRPKNILDKSLAELS